jgi:hypothetical protein
MRFGVLLDVSLSLVASCSPCDLPERTTYSCDPLPDPLPPGVRGCESGPIWKEDGKDHQDDIGTFFPGGCRAEIPSCNESYRSPRQFSCSPSGGGFEWLEDG